MFFLGRRYLSLGVLRHVFGVRYAVSVLVIICPSGPMFALRVQLIVHVFDLKVTPSSVCICCITGVADFAFHLKVKRCDVKRQRAAVKRCLVSLCSFILCSVRSLRCVSIPYSVRNPASIPRYE